LYIREVLIALEATVLETALPAARRQRHEGPVKFNHFLLPFSGIDAIVCEDDD
jgi:hypothetical protein